MAGSSRVDTSCDQGRLVITTATVSVKHNDGGTRGEQDWTIRSNSLANVQLQGDGPYRQLTFTTKDGRTLVASQVPVDDAHRVVEIFAPTSQVQAISTLPPAPPALPTPPAPTASQEPVAPIANDAPTLPSTSHPLSTPLSAPTVPSFPAVPAVPAVPAAPAAPPTYSSAPTTPALWAGAPNNEQQMRPPRQGGWRDRLRSLWGRGWAHKVGMIAVIPFLCICVCCSSSVIFAMTPYGQQLAREQNATDTAQAVLSAQQAASATAYARAHPKPTATSTATAVPTDTSTPQSTATATATNTTTPPTDTPLPQPTITSPPPPPPPTATPCPGVNCNPWGYNFSCCNYIYSPPSNFCDYFACIPSFWDHTNGYVEECQDGEYSHSGGVRGSCSYHGGDWRALLQP